MPRSRPRNSPRGFGWTFYVLVSGLVACGAWLAVVVSSAGNPSHLVLTTVKRQTITREVVAPGLVTYKEVATLGPPQAGLRLRRVLVSAGESVFADSPLMEFESTRPPVDISRRAILVRRAELTLQGKLNDPATSQVDLDLAKIDLEAAQADLEDAKRLGELEVVKAPFDGTVVQIPDPWGVGTNPVALVIARPSTLQVDVEVDDRDAAQVRAGQAVLLRIERNGDKPIEQRGIVKAAPALRRMRPQGAVFSVAITPISPELLRAGSAIVAHIAVEERKDAIVVPRSALVRVDGKSFVKVVRNGWIDTVEVTTGLETADAVEVIQGVSEGLRLVIDDLVNGTSDGGRGAR